MATTTTPKDRNAQLLARTIEEDYRQASTNLLSKIRKADIRGSVHESQIKQIEKSISDSLREVLTLTYKIGTNLL